MKHTCVTVPPGAVAVPLKLKSKDETVVYELSLIRNTRVSKTKNANMDDERDVTYVRTQQAPNPAAQFPSLSPPLSSHSCAVTHTPCNVSSDTAWQALKFEVF